jgi:hypothetical protein
VVFREAEIKAVYQFYDLVTTKLIQLLLNCGIRMIPPHKVLGFPNNYIMLD